MTVCGAKTRAGTPCQRPAGWGTPHQVGHCKLHGGRSPSGRKFAERLAAVQAVVVYGLPREIDPHAALLEELHRTAGHVAWLGQIIADGKLASEQSPTGRSRTVKLDQSTFSGAVPSVWVELYHRERRHFADVAKTCIGVGIEERRVRLAEQYGELLAQVIRGVLTDLGVADRPEVPAVVRRHLTVVAGTS